MWVKNQLFKQIIPLIVCRVLHCNSFPVMSIILIYFCIVSSTNMLVEVIWPGEFKRLELRLTILDLAFWWDIRFWKEEWMEFQKLPLITICNFWSDYLFIKIASNEGLNYDMMRSKISHWAPAHINILVIDFRPKSTTKEFDISM